MTIDKKTPTKVLDHFRKMQNLMEQDVDDAEVDLSPVQEDDIDINALKPSYVNPEPPESKRLYRLTMEHNLYKVSFMVHDISVADYQLAVRVPKGDFRFEPQPNSRFSIDCMGKNYSVVYLGGLFDFPSDDSWSLTFMMDNDDTWTQSS
jgi:hypothetical protein